MLFSSVTFLFYFLPGVMILYSIIPGKWKNQILLVASLLFYAWGEPVYSFLMLGAVLQSYIAARLTENAKTRREAKLWLIITLCFSIGMLVFFKYADFFIRICNLIPGIHMEETGFSLPVGISFYTFQMLSYNIDVYRKQVKANRSFTLLATYVAMFPQLIAGPIVRYSQINEELAGRKHTMELIYSGIRRFIVGLAKKVLIANQLGLFIRYFKESGEQSVVFYWLYAIGFTLQIYYDFSGYSDMAIGLGRIFGFRFMENFNYPYMAKSITEFWRRWHISLGTWFRDYVYIPLGGNRGRLWRQIFTILTVWMLTGFWHGAEWNFILWGLLYAVLLIFEKYMMKNRMERMPGFLAHGYVMFFVCMGFVIFDANSIREAWDTMAAMAGGRGLPFVNAETLYYMKSYAVVFLAAIVLCLKQPWTRMEHLVRRLSFLGYVEPVVLAGLVLMVTGFLVDGSFNPFLYFRF